MGEVPVLDASRSYHFTTALLFPPLEFNTLLENPQLKKTKGANAQTGTNRVIESES